MKYQALFSAEDKSKKLKRCLLQFLFGTLNGTQQPQPRKFQCDSTS